MSKSELSTIARAIKKMPAATKSKMAVSSGGIVVVVGLLLLGYWLDGGLTAKEVWPSSSQMEQWWQQVNDLVQGQPAVELESGQAEVVRVVDGDTVVVRMKGVEEKIRLIGMDTPEVVDPRKPVQCFGQEASNRAKQLLEHQIVRLEADASQGDRDKYGRLLRYIYLPDGRGFNLQMIAEGYAFEYTYKVPYQHQDEYQQAERQAREAGKGLWSEDTCGGQVTAASGE